MKYSISKIIVFFLLCLIPLFFIGCWDNRDVTELNMVSAVGLDKADDNKIEMTIQIMKPSIIKAEQQGSAEDAYWTFSTTGDTVFEAVRNILTTVDRQPFYSHVELMVIGEDIAKERMMDVLDFFERDPETRREAFILVAKGISAKKILEAQSNLESIPSLHIMEIIQTNRRSTKIKKITVIDFIKEMTSPGISPIAGVIQPKDNKENVSKISDLTVEGGAVFKNGKLVGWLGPETRGYLFVTGKVTSGIINIPNPLDADKKVAIEMKNATSKIDVIMKDGFPVLLVKIKGRGNLGEQQGGGNLATVEMVRKMEKEIEKTIEEEARNTIQLAQNEYKSDIFGFGKVVHRKYLSYWNQVKDDWNSEFQNLPVEIKVSMTLVNPGLIQKTAEAK